LGTAVGLLPQQKPPDWLALPGDAPALAELLAQASKRPQDLLEIGQALRALVESEYAVEACLARFLRVYEEVTGRT
jgi:glycosyltransferase involved in cell wall biosynthesis